MIRIPRNYLFQKLILEQGGLGLFFFFFCSMLHGLKVSQNWLFSPNDQNTSIYNTNSQTIKTIYVSSKWLRLQVWHVPSRKLLVKFGVEYLAHGNHQIICIPSILRRINSLSERIQVASNIKPWSTYKTSLIPKDSQVPFSILVLVLSFCEGRRLIKSCLSGEAVLRWEERYKCIACSHCFRQFCKMS